MSERMSEDMSERISEDMSERMSEDMAEDMSKRMLKDMSERMSKDMSERMSEDMSERMLTRQVLVGHASRDKKLCYRKCSKATVVSFDVAHCSKYLWPNVSCASK